MGEKLTTRDLKIHGFYICLILSGCLVFQTVFVWSKIPNVPELISFAVGLTSLVLAVIAIVQNLISTPQVAGSLQQLSGVGEDIRRSTETLNAASAGLSAKLSIIEAIPADVGHIKEGIDRLSSAQANAPVPKSDLAPIPEVKTVKRERLNLLASPSTFGGQVAVYIIARAYKLPSFNLSTIFPNDLVTAQYISGYLTCLRDYGFISFVSEKTEVSQLQVIADFDPAMAIAKTQSSDSDYIKPRMALVDTYINDYNAKIALLPVHET